MGRFSGSRRRARREPAFDRRYQADLYPTAYPVIARVDETVRFTKRAALVAARRRAALQAPRKPHRALSARLAVTRRTVGILHGPIGEKSILLSDRDGRLKRRKACKCSHERSDRQRKVSARLFGSYGSRGLERKHVCTCS